MRRRKSIIPALIVEGLAVAALAVLYVTINPFAPESSADTELPEVNYLADTPHVVFRAPSIDVLPASSEPHRVWTTDKRGANGNPPMRSFIQVN